MIRVLEPLYEWQSWPRGYEPSDKELAKMTDEEYEHYWADYERWLERDYLKDAGLWVTSKQVAQEWL